MPNLKHAGPNPHLSLDLQEVCAVVAAGLVRLRRHTADDLARDVAQAGDQGDVSLHIVGQQSSHAVRPRLKSHKFSPLEMSLRAK
jgi:hypothetical protein